MYANRSRKKKKSSLPSIVWKTDDLEKFEDFYEKKLSNDEIAKALNKKVTDVKKLVKQFDDAHEVPSTLKRKRESNDLDDDDHPKKKETFK